jgi:glucose/mannose transport system permease protein
MAKIRAAIGARRAIPSSNKGKKKKAYPWFSMTILIAAFLFFLLPIYVMVDNGLKDALHVDVATMWNLPETLGLGGFVAAWQQLSPNVYNSVVMVVPATFLSLLLGSINGYFLSKWKFRGSDTIFALILFGFFIPYQVILLPLVQFTQAIRVYGTLAGLILVHVVYGLPVCTLIFRNFYARISSELVEAAVVDGANKYQIYFHIMRPLAVPAFVVGAIFQFTNIWNDFLFGIVIIPTTQNQPITVALNNLSGNFSVDWNVVMAGAILAALPTGLVYILFSRHFVRGLLAGSIVG